MDDQEAIKRVESTWRLVLQLLKQDRLAVAQQYLNILLNAFDQPSIIVDIPAVPKKWLQAAGVNINDDNSNNANNRVEVSEKSYIETADDENVVIERSKRDSTAAKEKNNNENEENKNDNTINNNKNMSNDNKNNENEEKQEIPKEEALVHELPPIEAIVLTQQQKEIAQIAKVYEEMKNHSGCQKMQNELKHVQKFLSMVHDNSDWNKITEGNGIETYYRQEKDAATISIKMNAVFDSPIFNLLALANEVDLIEKFIPRIQAKLLKQVSTFRQFVHTTVGIPWPFNNRDMILDGHGINLLEHGQIVILARSYDPNNHDPEEWANVAVPQDSSSVTRMTVHLGGAVIVPIDRNTTYMSLVVNSDPKISYIPMNLINWVSKHLAYYACLMFRKQTHHIAGSEHERRIKEKVEIYGAIEEALTQYFQSQNR